jgi:hypothetical protein
MYDKNNAFLLIGLFRLIEKNIMHLFHPMVEVEIKFLKTNGPS